MKTEFIVTSLGRTHGTHTDFRAAKIHQIELFIDNGIEAWIEMIPTLAGMPGRMPNGACPPMQDWRKS